MNAPPFRRITVRVGRAGLVHIHAGEHALLRRMILADAAVERVYPFSPAVDALRRKRLVRRIPCDHPVPVYAPTRLGRHVAAAVQERLPKLLVARAVRAEAALASMEADHGR